MIEGDGEYIKEKTVSKDGRWSSVGSTSPVPRWRVSGLSGDEIWVCRLSWQVLQDLTRKKKSVGSIKTLCHLVRIEGSNGA